MTRNLIPLKVEKHLVLYGQMTAAIAACHRIDECKDIVNKSIAIAAYYAQIKDDEAVLKFNRIRLRAWRRIAELISTVDFTECDTHKAKIKKIRASFDEAALAQISDSRMAEVLKIASLSDNDFEHALSREVNGSINDLFFHTPQEEDRRRKSPYYGHPTKEETAEAQVLWQAQLQRERDEKEHLADLKQASEAALKEVGLTLTEKIVSK